MTRKPAVPDHNTDAGPDRFIPVYQPDLGGNEKAYVLECLETGWISSVGRFVPDFERSFAETAGLSHTVAVSNGTVALHLALHALGIGPGDEVIVPTFTYVASVNAIAQTGATPVFADCRPDDWLADVETIGASVTPRTRAIVAVHLFGAVADMTGLRAFADRHDLLLVEDCAQAIGSGRGGYPAGSLADAATFSFFGNKTITTGEGGMIGTRSAAIAERMRSLRSHAQSSSRRYWHGEPGFNYRMTNICAAIGLAQLERIDEVVRNKKQIARWYREGLQHLPVRLQGRAPAVDSSEWLVSCLLPPDADRDGVMERMLAQGIDTRPVFHCAHTLPMYSRDQAFPEAEDIARRGISLPSYPTLSESDVSRICGGLKHALAPVSTPRFTGATPARLAQPTPGRSGLRQISGNGASGLERGGDTR